MPRGRDAMDRVKVKREFPLAWLWEPLERDPGCVIKPMFGGRALYVDGKLSLYFCATEEPWCGVCAATDHERHAALIAECAALRPHEVLPKWLYLPETDPNFERHARWLVRLAGARDPRLGVIPPARRSRRRNHAS